MNDVIIKGKYIFSNWKVEIIFEINVFNLGDKL